MKNENKIIAHIAVLLTLLILIGLIKPVIGAVERDNSAALIRLGIMIVSTIMAMVFFIKSFINARKNKETKAF